LIKEYAVLTNDKELLNEAEDMEYTFITYGFNEEN
jgi:hypothetical protein